jgi:hypothetical protein
LEQDRGPRHAGGPVLPEYAPALQISLPAVFRDRPARARGARRISGEAAKPEHRVSLPRHGDDLRAPVLRELALPAPDRSRRDSAGRLLRHVGRARDRRAADEVSGAHARRRGRHLLRRLEPDDHETEHRRDIHVSRQPLHELGGRSEGGRGVRAGLPARSHSGRVDDQLREDPAEERGVREGGRDLREGIFDQPAIPASRDRVRLGPRWHGKARRGEEALRGGILHGIARRQGARVQSAGADRVLRGKGGRGDEVGGDGARARPGRRDPQADARRAQERAGIDRGAGSCPRAACEAS